MKYDEWKKLTEHFRYNYRPMHETPVHTAVQGYLTKPSAATAAQAIDWLQRWIGQNMAAWRNIADPGTRAMHDVWDAAQEERNGAAIQTLTIQASKLEAEFGAYLDTVYLASLRGAFLSSYGCPVRSWPPTWFPETWGSGRWASPTPWTRAGPSRAPTTRRCTTTSRRATV
jgi:hypothetical protein